VLAQIKSLGYRTLSASNGPEALNVLRGLESIDLLFTDVIMPGSINGRQLSIEALKLRPALKVLFTSGYTENAIDHHGRLDQGVQLLRKPYRRSDLANMIRTALTSGATDLLGEPAESWMAQSICRIGNEIEVSAIVAVTTILVMDLHGKVARPTHTFSARIAHINSWTGHGDVDVV
jgi:CheY-like chemotaxis protein